MKSFCMECNGRTLSMGEKPLIMGILNVTPDSFSDGGQFAETSRAVAHGLEMVRQGADILDIGGESTRPFSDPVSTEEEISRVAPVIEQLAKKVAIPISIDTTKAAVAKRALAAGASIINDVSALSQDPQMGEVAARSGAPVILMHMLGSPKTMQENPHYGDVVAEVRDSLGRAVDRAVSMGVDRNKIIVDPGIGFGKTVLHNLLLIKRLDALHSLDVPVLLGPSRKSFIRKILERAAASPESSPDKAAIEAGTQAVLALAARTGVHIVRVHDVSMARATLLLADAITRAF